MKKIFGRKWFTLIELMIVISIMWILLLFSYAPYTLYQNKAKLRLATREVSQTFSEGRNLAVSWFKPSGKTKNHSVILEFSSLDWENSKINYYFSENPLIYDKVNDKSNLKDAINEAKDEKKIKSKVIQDWIKFRKFEIEESLNIEEKIFVSFDAALWVVNIFDKDWGIINTPSLKIHMSFKNADENWILYRTITYIPKTNIVNYK